MIQTLHLMTQRDQPYGSVRKCCEICGLMMVDRDAALLGGGGVSGVG